MERDPQLLVVDDLVPDPRFGYGYPRSFSILKFLALSGFRVTFYPLVDKRRTESAATILESLGVRIVYDDTDHSRDIDSFLARESDRFDAIWVSRLKNLKVVLRARAQMCNDQFLIYDSEAFKAPGKLLPMHLDGKRVPSSVIGRARKEEIELTRAADIVIAVSQRDAVLLAESGISPVFILGHVLDPMDAPVTFEERTDILFLGGFFNRTPNEDAVQYFAKDIMPILNERIDAPWTIAGYRSEGVGSLLPKCSRDNIRIAGTVGDLRGLFARARVFVVPTRRWAVGLPHKVHQSLAHGVPAVGTPLIAEQLDDGTLLSGGNPSEFADNVCELYTNRSLWTSLRDGGLAIVDQDCNGERFLSTLAAIRASI
jgi:O-antigen biosynthesis protein